MEFSIGFRGNGFVLLASDTAAARSIMMFKQDQDKMIKLGSKKLMSVVGEPGDAVQFSEFVQKNLQLYKMRNGYEMSTQSMSAYTRRVLADALRSSPYFVHLLMAGHDRDECHLYTIDYLASCVEVPFAAHGYGSYFVLSLLDRWHNEDLSKDEAIILLKKCMAELKKRFTISLPAMTVRIVDKDGIHDLETLKEVDYV